jgi:hydrogenase nickel incorporation protein HypA/HybF
MHELSIIQEVVAAAVESAQQAGAVRVHTVKLRVGALAGVVKDSLLFCYDVASAGTLLAGSRLDIEELPVVIRCPQCHQDRELPGIQSFRCPVCGTPARDIVQGRELELTSIELEAA